MITSKKPISKRSYLPSNGGEMVTVMVHYYRGELVRMAGWRDRIDRTSNWAITVVAAMLSLSLSTPTSHHSVLLFTMLLITLLLLIEARRYRFFDVYRDRVRLLECHYFANAIGESTLPSESWTEQLSSNLKSPHFNISLLAAMTPRLRRNNIWMYLILLLAWLLKITTPLLQPEGTHLGWREPFVNMVSSAEAGPISGSVVIVVVIAFYVWLGWMVLHADDQADGNAGEVHV